MCLNIVSLFFVFAFRPESDDDREAVEECVKGDRDAFDLLVKKY